MRNLTPTTLKDAKNKLLNENKALKSIISELNINCTANELNDALIKKYGTDTVGNPAAKSQVVRRAKKMVDNALLEFPKAKVLELLDELKDIVNQS